MTSVLIIGSAGFIGRHAARAFAQKDWYIYGVDALAPEKAAGPDVHEYVSLKLPSDELPVLVRRLHPDVCVHCAGDALVTLSVRKPKEDFDSHVPVTFNLLDALRQGAPDCRLIFISSAAVYGNPDRLPVTEDQAVQPISPYGFHKAICEQICREFTVVYGLRTAILRVFSAYGPGLRRQVLWDICRKAILGQSLKLFGTGGESRDFVHVEDIAQAALVAAEAGTCRGEVYNVASGVETTILELADFIVKGLGLNIPILFDGQVPEGTPINWRADIGRLRNLGFAPRLAIPEGLPSYLAWARSELTNE